MSHPSLQSTNKSEHSSLQLTVKEGHASLEYVAPEPQPEEQTHEEPQTIQIQNLPDFQSTFQPIVTELQGIQQTLSKLSADTEEQNSLKSEVLRKLKTKLANV